MFSKNVKVDFKFLVNLFIQIIQSFRLNKIFFFIYKIAISSFFSKILIFNVSGYIFFILKLSM